MPNFLLSRPLAPLAANAGHGRGSVARKCSEIKEPMNFSLASSARLAANRGESLRPVAANAGEKISSQNGRTAVV